MYSFSLLYKELQKKKRYNPFSYMLVCICMHVCVYGMHVYILTLVFGYLVRISFIPQIAKIDNRKK